ncbi:MAG: GTP cyclohydrolase FolE2 [bacterium]
MNDVQNYRDTRNITVDQVGVWDIEYPVIVKDKANTTQNTVASIDMTVMLLPEFKGTHMSRMIEVLNSVRGEITVANIPNILKKLKERLSSPQAIISMRFPYFIEKKAPVSKFSSMFPVSVLFSGFSDEKNGESFILGVRVPVTTLCPCSKEISTGGAHNQRSFVTLYLKFKDFVWIEDVVQMIETSASCEIYPLLKREDEKHVTEKAYLNPVFTEDLVRNISEKIIADSDITWFLVETLHFESIHTHNAYARIERFKEKSFLLEEHLRVFKGFPKI